MASTQPDNGRSVLRRVVQFILVAVALFIIWYALFASGSFYKPTSIASLLQDSEEHSLCYGPRGKIFLRNKDDMIQETVFDPSPEDPMLGSYEALYLQQTWSTADGRYGPYGRGQNNSNYQRKKVNWNTTDWSHLQSQCILRNNHRFGSAAQPITSNRRMAYPKEQNSAIIRARANRTTGRTAIVLRGWEEFVFHEENNWYIRSLISETTLYTSGDYGVFILVDIHDTDAKIFSSRENYDRKLAEVIPPEFRNMSILFDESLLEAWYPKTSHHDMKYQHWQPLQLFAHFFDDFDHYWQLEMDMRFLGHAGKILNSFAEFGRQEPRKQARERASYMFTPKTYGTYANLTAQVNKSLNGGTQFWQGIRIPDIDPIVPLTPTLKPEDDHFAWGVGEEADFLSLGPCSNMTLLPEARQWIRYVNNFQLGQDTPRIVCPPAMGRLSWNLLNAAHNLQIEKGLELPSEVQMPSFALYLNLKISKVPFPLFTEGHQSPEYIDRYMNGNSPEPQYHGMARVTQEFWEIQNPDDRPRVTWRAHSSYAKRIFFAWLDDTPKLLESEKPQLLHLHDGQLYAPNCILHPAKFNAGPPGSKED